MLSSSHPLPLLSIPFWRREETDNNGKKEDRESLNLPFSLPRLPGQGNNCSILSQKEDYEHKKVENDHQERRALKRDLFLEGRGKSKNILCQPLFFLSESIFQRE